MKARLILVSLLAAVCLALPQPAIAQTVSQIERKFLPFRAELPTTTPAFNQFWEGLTLLNEEEARQRQVRREITLGFSGDETNRASLFRLKTGTTLARGFYPGELRFEANVGLQIQDGKLEEDLTRLLMNYDFHPSQYSEYYVFVERFSDNFLSIDQRYEVGFGGLFGANLLRTSKWADLDRKLTAFSAAFPTQVKTALDGLNNNELRGRTKPADTDYQQLSGQVGRIRQALVQKEPV